MSVRANIQRYRGIAARLRQLTQQMAFPENRAETLKIAAQFERLAEHVERRLNAAPARPASVLPFRRAS